MRRAVALAALAVGVLASARARADALFEITVMDEPDVGFHDPTPVAPVGGNAGTTLGEQRLNALQRATEIWGAALDSDVPIEVAAVFSSIGCEQGGTILAYAGSESYEFGLERDGARVDRLYSSALANRLEGEDIKPDEPDIHATFNLDVDETRCLGGGFYYGLDAKYGGSPDFVNVALHELGHGLGFQSSVALNGGLFAGMIDSFSAHLFDRTLGQGWADLSADERLMSMSNVRNLVWSGEHVAAEARAQLSPGAPTLSTTPVIDGFEGLVGDANFGSTTAALSLSAELALGNPMSGCGAPSGAAGKVLLMRPQCEARAVLALAEQRGAVGVLMAFGAAGQAPPQSLDNIDTALEPIGIPVYTITESDAQLLEAALAAGGVTVNMSRDPDGLVGADDQGRPYMHATRPVPAGPSHWDTLERPSLLMEPFEQPHDRHSLDLTPALMRDIGWARFCGNARLDQDEECDQGSDNADDVADACRSDCTAARCGDAVIDSAEGCDDGALNSDSAADACRGDCSTARCGDGVIDSGEACDQGAQNSDTVADVCRSDCSTARCGDGVVDKLEACDDGADNADDLRDACRADCSQARCGDGVVDTGEACDDGTGNSDLTPDACRGDCSAPACGDRVVDDGEACDDGARNSDSVADACRRDCTTARCGDGVVDTGEDCDGTAECPADCTMADGPPDAGTGAGGAGNDKPTAETLDGGGCGCRVGAREDARGGGLVGLFALAWLARSTARRSGRRQRSGPRNKA